MTTYASPADGAAVNAASDQTEQCEIVAALFPGDVTPKVYGGGVLLATVADHGPFTVGGTDPKHLVHGARLAPNDAVTLAVTSAGTSGVVADTIKYFAGATEVFSGPVTLQYPVKSGWPIDLSGFNAWTANPDLPTAGGGGATLTTTVTLSADATVTPGAAELVTFGLPIAYDINITPANLASIRVRVGGTEIGAFVKAGLRHWNKTDTTRLRSITVQVVRDMTGGDVVLSIDNAGSTVARITEAPIDNGWVAGTGLYANDPDARVLKHPRIYALHDQAYVAGAGFLPPYSPLSAGGRASQMSDIIPDCLGTRDYTSSAATSYTEWLYCIGATAGKMSLVLPSASDRKTLLRHCALAKRLYCNYLNESSGYFEYPGWVPQDLKHLQAEDMLIAIALLGDDTQNPATKAAAISTVVRTSAIGSVQSTMYPINTEYKQITERNSGIPLQTLLDVWMLTGESAAKTACDTHIANIKAWQQTAQSYDTSYSWPMNGGLRHSILRHEGFYIFGTCATTSGSTTCTVDSYTTEANWDEMIARGVKVGFGLDIRTVTDAVSVAPNSRGGGTFTITVSSPFTNTHSAGTNMYTMDDSGASSDRGQSSWMSVLVIQSLWKAWHLYEPADVPEIIRQLGNHLDAYAFTSDRRSSGSYAARTEWTSVSYGSAGNTNPAGAYPLYIYHDLANMGRLDSESEAGFTSGGFNTDHHCAEIQSALAIAWSIEADATRKAQLAYRVAAIDSATAKANFPASGVSRRGIGWMHNALPYAVCEGLGL